MSRDPVLPVRTLIADLEDSPIREIAHAGMNMPDVVPLWFGEPDLPTDALICDAAARALKDGETFYTSNRGVPALRESLARYMTRLYDREIDTDRVTITCAGMNALMLVAETLIDPGDNIVITCPLWPNFFRCIEIMGGEPRYVPLDETESGWSLDLDRIFDACDDRTRAICINSPSNPTGWMMSADDQRTVLEECRKRGLWIIADEVYARVVYDRPHAPSFLEQCEPGDLVISVNSFSKAWAMTGWRLGWVTAPAGLGTILAKLNEFNVAAPASFTQIAGITAVEQGDPLIHAMVERYRVARDVIHQRLRGYPRVHMARPEAAFYAYFSVDGVTDSRAFALKALNETKVGLAPGIAFGPFKRDHLRICYAKSTDLLTEALDRLEPLLR